MNQTNDLLLVIGIRKTVGGKQTIYFDPCSIMVILYWRCNIRVGLPKPPPPWAVNLNQHLYRTQLGKIIIKSNATKNFISLYDITKKVRDQETTANKVYCLAEIFLWLYGSKVSCFIFQNIAILVTRRRRATLLLLVSNQGNDLVLVFGIRITVGDKQTIYFD